jgi:4-methyl-5(b-hydroxyethyl)-thiazole monophosphate biosynthesis
MGVAPLVAAEEVMIVGGKIKSHTITITPESLAKIQAAMAAQAKAATPKKVLLFAKEAPNVMELMLTQEVGVMMSMLEKAGFKVVVASISGQPITGGTATLKPDMKLADVKVEDYVGFLLPCMAVDVIPAEAAEMVKKAVALEKPVAAQNGSVFILAKAGLLNGKQFAVFPGYEKMVPAGIYKGAGVVQDGNVITSGSCPFAGRDGKYPDTTAELTQKFITMLASAR